MRGPAGKGTAQIAVHRSIPTAFRRQPENLEHLFEEMKMKAINRVRSWASDAAFASFIPAQAKLPEIIAPSTTLLYENPSPDAFAFAVTFIHLDWRSIFKDILLASPLAG